MRVSRELCLSIKHSRMHTVVEWDESVSMALAEGRSGFRCQTWQDERVGDAGRGWLCRRGRCDQPGATGRSPQLRG